MLCITRFNTRIICSFSYIVCLCVLYDPYNTRTSFHPTPFTNLSYKGSKISVRYKMQRKLTTAFKELNMNNFGYIVWLARGGAVD